MALMDYVYNYSEHPQKHSSKHVPEGMSEKEYKRSVRSSENFNWIPKQMEKEFEGLKREETIESNPKSTTMPRLNDIDLEKAKNPGPASFLDTKKLLQDLLSKENEDYIRTSSMDEDTLRKATAPLDEFKFGAVGHKGNQSFDSSLKEIREINSQEDLDRLEHNDSGVVLLNFYDQYSTRYRRLYAQLFTNLNSLKKGWNFASCNVDKNKNIAEKLNVTKGPCVVLIQDGNVKARIDGEISEQNFQEFLKETHEI